MLLLPFSAQLAPFPNHCATSAALRCLFAYSRELEDSQIEVEVADGVIILTGSAPCDAAVRKAVGIATDLTSKPVLNHIQVKATSPTASPEP
ncbi:BON domain-containing protein [Rhizobium sp. PL01]|uniref:BON domain-containing protein n=1 Tax=Rhizobium sp. PL01 TaxID=3085631 RepID=UPI0029816BAF|nr:BON domain-containing protein [Rhizobium sp. PL01]MDW5317075.1 BON domain-containing protein [Rhizobium sp. PL01]